MGPVKIDPNHTEIIYYTMGDPIFQRSLQDLIKGIRANKRDVATYISQSIADIKNELKSTDPFLKSEAVRKLTYLQMIGYNVSWASFSIVEVMSQPRFAHKRIGYLAANQVSTNRRLTQHVTC